MFICKSIRLSKTTLAVESFHKGTQLVHVPEGSIIDMFGEPAIWERMVDIRWRGRELKMFSLDIAERGTTIRVWMNAVA